MRHVIQYLDQMIIIEACIGYFGIRDIGLFLRDTGIFVFFYFGIWDIA